MGQVTQAGQRMGQARYRGFGQARALGDVTVAEDAVAGLKRAQHAEPPRQGGDKLAVFAFGCFGVVVQRQGAAVGTAGHVDVVRRGSAPSP